MRLFYSPDIEITNTLSEEESLHCTKVLRFKNNEVIFITDGKGNLFKVRIIDINFQKIKVEILETISEYGKRPYYVHIAIAPTKNIDRIEWFIEKAVEIGIDEITPIICKNSERKVLKLDRLNRIIESAMKQSYKAYHTKVNDVIKYNDFIKLNYWSNQKFIAHCENDEKEYLAKILHKNLSYLIMIGPEGDFSSDEIILAENNNFISTSLGNSRLRTETAGVVACDIASIINQI